MHSASAVHVPSLVHWTMMMEPAGVKPVLHWKKATESTSREDGMIVTFPFIRNRLGHMIPVMRTAIREPEEKNKK